MAARRKRKVRWPRMDRSDIPLRDIVSEYLQYHDGLDHSPKTTRWYADVLFALNRFLGEEALLADLTGPRLRPYQSHFRSRSRRALVDQYTKYAEQLGFDYPRSKNMLKRIADSWASHARMADMESELREDLSD